MYICVCKAVNEKTIKEAIRNGINDIKKLQKKTGLGTGCGTCLDYASDYLDKKVNKEK